MSLVLYVNYWTNAIDKLYGQKSTPFKIYYLEPYRLDSFSAFISLTVLRHFGYILRITELPTEKITPPIRRQFSSKIHHKYWSIYPGISCSYKNNESMLNWVSAYIIGLCLFITWCIARDQDCMFLLGHTSPTNAGSASPELQDHSLSPYGQLWALLSAWLPLPWSSVLCPIFPFQSLAKFCLS